MKPTALLIALVLGLTSAPVFAADRSEPPDWAKDAIWYQIFPERFRNGDRRNDPTPRDMEGAWPHDPIGEWHVSPWTSDWYRLQPWETSNGRGFSFNAQRRRYGGDLQGIIDELPYLKALGVNTIYLNPIFESPSLHKYDASMYHHVDNNFGPDPEGDRAIWASENPADPSTWKWTSADKLFLSLIASCHKRGIRVVIDGVFNHVGQTFWAFKDVVARGATSAYVDWFTIERFDDPATPANEFAYKAWFGVKELPELRDEEDSLAVGPREHIHAIVKRWGDPNGDGDPSDGIDGWRLDAAENVGHGFWKLFRSWVREVNPNSYISAELWWEDWKNDKIFNAAPWLAGDQFDAVMNYRLTEMIKAFLVDRAKAIAPSEFDRRLAALRADYRPETNYALMNLMDSHDTDRLASIIVNPDRQFDRDNSPNADATYSVRAPTAAERARQRLVAAFQFAYVGAPMIYYGDECGMWGADDPDERKPMVWPDLRYEREATDPLGRPRTADDVRFDRSLVAFYSALARIRRGSEALRRGSFETVLADDAQRVYAFARSTASDRVIAVFNASEKPATVALPKLVGRYTDLLAKRRVASTKGGVRVTLAPLGFALLEAS